jgi:hypothetical protein
MSRGKIIVAAICLVPLLQVARADVLRLKSGATIQGALVTANSNGVSFKAEGGTRSYPLSAVDGIDFAPLPAPPAAVKAEEPVAAAAIVVPAGTEISVRLIDAIQGTATGAGQRYKASVDDPVVVNNEVVIPRGANCTVQVVALENGQDIELRLYDVSVRGKSYATASESAVVKAEGKSKGRKAARRGIGLGALGAGIGALAGGGEAAAIGAVVGGGVGAVSAAGGKGKQISVPSETQLGFKLKAPLPLT